MAEYLVPKSAV
ncbi:IMPACT family member YigZ, partial [Haemophilus influenzae]